MHELHVSRLIERAEDGNAALPTVIYSTALEGVVPAPLRTSPWAIAVAASRSLGLLAWLAGHRRARPVLLEPMRGITEVAASFSGFIVRGHFLALRGRRPGIRSAVVEPNPLPRR